MREDETKNLLDIEKYMPRLSADALRYFVELNPNMKGAQWADVLDNLNQSDCHLDITEPIWEECSPYVTIEESHLIPLIAYTLTYAHSGAPALVQQVLYWLGYIAGRREIDAQANQ